VVLHGEAHPHRLAILELVEAMSALPDTSSRLKAALGKWPGLFARLALVFHLVEIADANARNVEAPSINVLSGANAAKAAAYMRDVLLPHLLRAEAVMFSTEQTGHARWIAGFILSRGGDRIAVRDVVQAYGPLRPPERRKELLGIMESLESVGWLKAEPQMNPAKPTAAWAINPAVHAVFAARARAEREARQQAKERIAETVARLRRGAKP
jgi:hypothetical protein